MALESLLSPIKIGSLEIKNRVVLAPMGIGIRPEDEMIPEQMVRYYEERAKGDVGLIITQNTCVSELQKGLVLGAYDDKFIPGFKRLGEACHRHGAKVFQQLALLGGKVPPSHAPGYAPSAIESPLYSEVPIELTQHLIEVIIQDFIEAARRAREAGLDGVEVHGAHSYLIGQFMSPHSNHRNDNYGGDFDRRMKMPVLILEGIRKYVGEDFPVGFKFSAHEELQFGVDGILATKIAQRMVEAGAAYLHVASTASTIEALSDWPSVPPIYMPRQTLLPLAENIHENITSVPIIATGSINVPEEADEIISRGSCDMVAVGRGLLADPHWVRHAKEGKHIVQCIRCNVCHDSCVIKRGPIKCTVNPFLTREKLMDMLPAEKTKKVLVVGGGPGGIQTALIASSRGHNVVLCERSDRLGGMLIPASKLSLKNDFVRYLDYMVKSIEESNVEVLLGVDVNQEYVKSFAPDALVLAIGAEMIQMEVPGIDREKVVTAIDVLMNSNLITAKRVVVVGGGNMGCETALYLKELGVDVTIIEKFDILMLEEEVKNNTIVLESLLKKSGVIWYLNATLVKIDEDKIIFNEPNGQRQFMTDLVVIASGFVSNPMRLIPFKDTCDELYAVGDALEPRHIWDAISEATEVGRKI